MGKIWNNLTSHFFIQTKHAAFFQIRDGASPRRYGGWNADHVQRRTWNLLSHVWSVHLNVDVRCWTAKFVDPRGCELYGKLQGAPRHERFWTTCHESGLYADKKAGDSGSPRSSIESGCARRDHAGRKQGAAAPGHWVTITHLKFCRLKSWHRKWWGTDSIKYCCRNGRGE